MFSTSWFSSLNMSKMAKLFEAQKPGKNRAKINSVEEFIKATGISLAKNKLILEDINDIVQKRIVLQSVGEKKTQEIDDSVTNKSMRSPSEAKKANMKPGKEQNPAREGIGASLHPCRNRLNLKNGQKVSNPKLRDTNTRQKVSNLENGQKCRKGRRAVMPLKTTGSRQKVCKHVSMVSLAPGHGSSVLAEPEGRSPRGNPKLEEQSVGGGVALLTWYP